MQTMTDQSPDNPKTNWPLILGGVTVGILAIAVVGGLVAMYVANFNLLDWLE